MPTCWQVPEEGNLLSRTSPGRTPTMFLPMTDALLLSLFAGGLGLAMGAGLPALLKALWRRHRAVAAARLEPPAPARAQASCAGRQVVTPVRPPMGPPLPAVVDLLLVDDPAVVRAKLRQ